jgi:peroxin-1
MPKPSSSPAEVSLLPALKSCLVNLPPSLVAVLTNANTLAQNVVVELTFRQPLPPKSGDGKDRPASVQRSVYVGWTGMPSRSRPSPVVGRGGIAGVRGNAPVRDHEVAAVELDPVFARLVALSEGQKVGIILHVDPPQAHTINIEPLTPADWEMIELRAEFLELNFLSQVRALPNPAYSDPRGAEQLPPHPVTLHLSPTSAANVIVSSVAPPPPANAPFVKISPDAEIIVAPKERQRERPSSKEGRSVTSKRSVGGRSGASTVRRKSSRDHSHRAAIFLRGLDRGVDCDWFDQGMDDQGLTVWVDRGLLATRSLKGVHCVSVSVVKPQGIAEKVDAQKDAAETEKPTTKVVARIEAWDDAPDSQHVAMSSMLCRCLSSEAIFGGLVRIQAAPPQLDPKSKDAGSKLSLKVIPFIQSSASRDNALKFGGEEKDQSWQRLYKIFSGKDTPGLLDGPLVDGMLLPEVKEHQWHGGILRFNPPSKDDDLTWILAPKKPLSVEFLPEVPRPTLALKSWSPGDELPAEEPSLVGVDSVVDQLVDNLSNLSPVLLTGGLGSGKTSIAHLVAHRLRSQYLFHPIYLPCRTKMSGEHKITSIKETFERLFSAAVWGARSGGRSVVILDDIDAVCFAETELGEGGDNDRTRHVSEGLCVIVRQLCTADSNVVLLATAQSKEALNNIIIGSHVIREIVNLSAPTKEKRRQVLESVVRDAHKEPNGTNGAQPVENSRSSKSASRPSTSQGPPGFGVSQDLDFLDLAGQTDGYMPGDLILLASRARSECLIRSLASSTPSRLTLTRADFAAALKGFTPASLRNVTLQTSTVKWSSIGGLASTRQVLLETLQYPTSYAPIFASCPLRLRSGLLLYGYPGCGKTLLASAVAGECGLNFISVKGPEILNKYIGASEKSVRDLFERAQAARPCVLFFDEFDAIAPKRGHDSTGVTDRVVNQLLTQMDGAEGLEGVYVLGATSRPDLIDPALLRPGRLDKSLLCDMPNADDREAILRAVAAPLPVDDAVRARWGDVAARARGCSGADLQALVYNAHLEAVHESLERADGSASGGAPAVNGAEEAGSGRAPAFDIVLAGGGDDGDEDGAPQRLGAAERAAVAARLREMQAARRRARLASAAPAPSSAHNHHQHHHAAHSEHEDDEEDDGEEHREEEEEEQEAGPTIMWRHVQRSLAATRPSISVDERRRLERIYREFVVGRSGDLPSGQGGTEIGGRSSLM